MVKVKKSVKKVSKTVNAKVNQLLALLRDQQTDADRNGLPNQRNRRYYT